MGLYPLPPSEARQSMPELIRQLLMDIRELIQQHIELTKTEVRAEGKRLAKAGVLGLVAVMLTQVCLIYLGSLLVITLLSTTTLGIVGATFTTFLVFLVLTGLCAVLIVREVREMRQELAARPSSSP